MIGARHPMVFLFVGDPDRSRASPGGTKRTRPTPWTPGCQELLGKGSARASVRQPCTSQLALLGFRASAHRIRGVLPAFRLERRLQLGDSFDSRMSP